MLRSKFITLQQEYYDVPDDETLEFISDTLKKAEELSTLKVDIEILKKTVEELSQKITPQ